jgi:hypothetical protein
MSFTTELQSVFENIFNTWCLKIINIENDKFGKNLNISDFNPLKEKIYDYIGQNIETEDDTSSIEEVIFDYYSHFMLEIHEKCTGDTIYCWILQNLIMKHIFKREPLQSFEDLIKTRLQNIQEIYLSEYNPVGNFGDLFQ